MAEQKNITTYIYLGLVLIIFVLVYFLVYPAIIELKDTEKSKLALEKELNEKEQTLLKFEEVAAKYKEKKEEFSKIPQMISKEPDLIFQLIQFENLASNNGMVTEDISFEPLAASEKGNVGIFPINIQVSGSYENFKNFLDSLAKNLNLIDVQSIIFSPVGKEGEGMASAIKEEEGMISETIIEDKYTFSLKVNTYTEKMPVSEEPASEGEEEKLEEEL